MTIKETTIPFEEIENTPAAELLKLSHAELNAHIRCAERLITRSQNLAYWLGGIKIEKTLRENLEITDLGGAQ